jgi:hypothetical protein
LLLTPLADAISSTARWMLWPIVGGAEPVMQRRGEGEVA